MSWGDHDHDLINQKLGVKQRLEAEKNLTAKPSKSEEDDIKHDFMMLERLSKYQITDKHMKIIHHIVEKVPDHNKEQMFKNYIQGLIGAAVMDYENQYVRLRPDVKTWF